MKAKNKEFEKDIYPLKKRDIKNKYLIEKKNIIKINHRKDFDKSGCVYQRGFNINKDIYQKFLKYFNSIKNKQKDYYKKLYLNCNFKIEIWENVYYIYLNLTQTDLFLKFLDKEKINYDKKRANIKANGYLIIKDYNIKK